MLFILQFLSLFTNALLEISPIHRCISNPPTTHTMDSPALPTADGAEAEDDQRFGGRKGALERAQNELQVRRPALKTHLSSAMMAAPLAARRPRRPGRRTRALLSAADGID